MSAAALAGGCAEERLSETGLYADIEAGALAEGVRPFRPRFELWSDGASKQRWVWLPPDTRIDTDDMDGWTFPAGTKLWKEFTRDGVRVETRLLQKNGPGRDDWSFMAYVWSVDQTDAVAAPNGQRDALGTPHDVPDTEACQDCHSGAADAVLGFSAIQLDHALGDLDLPSLLAEGRLTAAPASPFTVPGDDVQRAALGYLHVNCGQCHNNRAAGAGGVHLQLELLVDELGTVEETAVYRTAVEAPTRVPDPLPATAASTIVAPGDPEASLLYIRMLRREPEPGQMPPIASELVDEAGSEAIAAWITSLAP